MEYLTISGTKIKWRAIITFIPTWNNTMVDLTLPLYVEYVLYITTEHPDLAMKNEFMQMIGSMKSLQLLSINQYRIFCPVCSRQTEFTILLRELLPGLIINYNPFTTKGPAPLDPSSLFENMWTPYRIPKENQDSLWMM